MKWIVSRLVLVFALVSSRADARMMQHLDLSGLLLYSDSVVIADRVGPSPTTPVDQGRTRYRVTRVLRGPIKVATEVEVWDSLYEKTSNTVILFLDAKHELVISGLRAFENGKLLRFEQWNNPGGWTAVPQGEDPQDQWRTTPQLDLAGFERALAAAAKRIDAFEAAKQLTDVTKRRAALLALFAPPGGARGGGGFYHDELAERARVFLGGAGDIEGALMITLRDRSHFLYGVEFATVPQLLAFVGDIKRDLDVRVAAIATARESFHIIDDDANIAALIKLIDDPAAIVRAEAIQVAASMTDMMSSDKAEQKRINATRVKVRSVLAKKVATETDPIALAALAEAFTDVFKTSVPANKGPALVGRARVAGDGINVDLRCLKSVRAKDMKLLATSTSTGVTMEVGAINIWLHCGTGNGIGGGQPTPFAAGNYTLTVEVGTKPTPIKVPVGTLSVDANHEMRIAP